MENNDIKTIDDIIDSGPYKNDGIYLENSNNNNILAVCSTPKIANMLSKILNSHHDCEKCTSSKLIQLLSNLPDLINNINKLITSNTDNKHVKTSYNGKISDEIHLSEVDKIDNCDLSNKISLTVKGYADLVQKAKYLDVAIQQAKIPINDLNCMLLEKSYHEFKESLDNLIKNEKLEFVDSKEETDRYIS